MNKTNTNDLRKVISEILVQNNMPTRQVAISELVAMIRVELSLAEARGAERVIEGVSEYLEHTRDCILSFWEEGRATIGGGYEEKYRGKWYESRPIDRIPKCNCGLSTFLTK